MRKLGMKLPRDRALAAMYIRTARSLLSRGPLARTAAPVYNLAASLAESELLITFSERERGALRQAAWMLSKAAETAAVPGFILADDERISA